MRFLALVSFVVLIAVGVATDMAGAKVESSPTSYSQEVDSTTKDRFKANKSWGTSSYRLDLQDASYRFAPPAEGGSSAQFKVKIPEAADYAVYARWPRVKGLNASVPVGVETDSGVEWTKVNQQQDGGDWVKVGVFKMPASDDYSVQFSPEMDGEGYAAADAVKVVKVSSDAPPPQPRKKYGSARPKGREVVKEARTYMRAPYHLGRASRTRGMDCSGFTMLVYRKFGVSLPHDVRTQARFGSKDQKPRAGDLVFFNEHGRGVSHVGIATGRGTIIHASNYFHRVTETPIKSVKGYMGSKRLL